MPESWNTTFVQPQSLEKKENHHKSSQAHIPTFWESTVFKSLEQINIPSKSELRKEMTATPDPAHDADAENRVA